MFNKLRIGFLAFASIFSLSSYAETFENGFFARVQGEDSLQYALEFCHEEDLSSCFEVIMSGDEPMFIPGEQKDMFLRMISIIRDDIKDVVMEFGDKGIEACTVSTLPVGKAKPFGLGFSLLSILHLPDFENGFAQLICNRDGTHWKLDRD